MFEEQSVKFFIRGIEHLLVIKRLEDGWVRLSLHERMNIRINYLREEELIKRLTDGL